MELRTKIFIGGSQPTEYTLSCLAVIDSSSVNMAIVCECTGIFKRNELLGGQCIEGLRDLIRDNKVSSGSTLSIKGLREDIYLG